MEGIHCFPVHSCRYPEARLRQHNTLKDHKSQLTEDQLTLKGLATTSVSRIAGACAIWSPPHTLATHVVKSNCAPTKPDPDTHATWIVTPLDTATGKLMKLTTCCG